MPSTTPLRKALPLGLVLLALALGACDGSAPVPSASAASPSPSVAARCSPDQIETSGINGSIVDSDGNPLGDIFVQIATPDGFRGTTRTAEDGAFTAPGVSGEFVITTVDIDYATVTQRVSVPCGETVDVELVLTPAGE
jgi:hypothetical protein